MILIFGGAYQGKADFAKRTFGLEDEDIFYCGESSGQKGLAQESGEIPALSPQAEGARAIHGLEKAFLDLVRTGTEPKDFLAAHREQMKDKILMINDISQGIVPVDPVLRAWREAVGRAMLWLASESEQVYRVFCGMEQRLK